MAWTTPITWAVNQVVTAAQMNQQVRDNENWLGSRHGCGVYHSSADPTIANNTDTAITWDGEEFNSEGAGLHSTSVNPSRLIVPAGMAGLWRVQAVLAWVTSASGQRQVWLRKNGAGASIAGSNFPAAPAGTITVAVDKMVVLAVGDYLEVMAWQNSGAGLAVSCNGTMFGTGALASHSSYAEFEFMAF